MCASVGEILAQMRNGKPVVSASVGQDLAPPTKYHSENNLWHILFSPSVRWVSGVQLHVSRLVCIIFTCLVIFQSITQTTDFNMLHIHVYGLCVYMSYTGNIHPQNGCLPQLTKRRKWRWEEFRSF